ncbi:MAG TPA: hypothetical protein VFU89_07155, partial [Rhabdochlamydiaceae bacterium]|nr:hypothetical protein [Rhabdochlamydiaceae bacterium]
MSSSFSGVSSNINHSSTPTSLPAPQLNEQPLDQRVDSFATGQMQTLPSAMMGQGTNPSSAFSSSSAFSATPSSSLYQETKNYELGHGKKKDYPRALSRYEQLAKAGNPVGMIKTALFLCQGIGGPKNLAGAFQHVQKALEIGLTSPDIRRALFVLVACAGQGASEAGMFLANSPESESSYQELYQNGDLFAGWMLAAIYFESNRKDQGDR